MILCKGHPIELDLHRNTSAASVQQEATADWVFPFHNSKLLHEFETRVKLGSERRYMYAFPTLLAYGRNVTGRILR